MSGPSPSLLDQTLAAAVRDAQMVTTDSRPVVRLTEGVVIREVATHFDLRGSLVELLDGRWPEFSDPIVSAYSFTIRPGYAKGWNLHKEHVDRYFVLQGEMDLVLFDPRPESSTCGEVCKIVLSGHERRIVTVPKMVWHADHNIGTTEVVAISFPTRVYDHANPDKYRLPLDTPLIPYNFRGARGW